MTAEELREKAVETLRASLAAMQEPEGLADVEHLGRLLDGLRAYETFDERLAAERAEREYVRGRAEWLALATAEIRRVLDPDERRRARWRQYACAALAEGSGTGVSVGAAADADAMVLLEDERFGELGEEEKP